MKPNLESIEIILFDLGGVLIDINYQATSQEMNKLGFLEFDNHYSQFEQNDLFNLLETGKISEQRFINELKNFTFDQVSPNQLVHAWNKMIGAFPKRKFELLEKLKGKRIAMLSNTNSIHWKRVLQEWRKVSALEIESYFEKIFLSHEIGLRKPNQETFEFVCNELSETPDRILFIDDSPQHIKGAQLAGMNTFYYTEEDSFYKLFS